MDNQRLNSSRVKEILQDCAFVLVYFPSGTELKLNYRNFVSDFNEYDLWDGINYITLRYDLEKGYIGGVYLA